MPSCWNGRPQPTRPLECVHAEPITQITRISREKATESLNKSNKMNRWRLFCKCQTKRQHTTYQRWMGNQLSVVDVVVCAELVCGELSIWAVNLIWSIHPRLRLFFARQKRDTISALLKRTDLCRTRGKNLIIYWRVSKEQQEKTVWCCRARKLRGFYGVMK